MVIRIDRHVPPVGFRIVCGLSFFVLMPSLVTAASDFEATIEAGVTYADNINLAAIDEQSEIVYRAAPSFMYSQDSTRFTTLVNYRLEGFYYSDLGETATYHQFDGSIQATLIPENLFVNIGAIRNQSIVDPDAQLPGGNLPFSSNRVDRDEYYVSPTYQTVLGRSVTVQSDYRLSWVEYDDPTINNLDQLATGNFAVENYREGSGLTWAARYAWRRAEYDNFDPWEYQQASGELGFWAGKGLRIFSSVGKESNWEMPLDPGLEDTFWEAGFARQVGTGFSAEFAAGERSFGSSWRGNLQYTFRRGNTLLQYSETATTAGQDSFNRSRFQFPRAPNDTLVRPGSGQRYIRKRFQWNVDFNLRRMNIGIVAYDGQQSDRTEADGTPLPNTDQRGVIVNTTLQVGPRTSLTVTGSWLDRETNIGDSSELIRASVTAGYELGSDTQLSLNYSYAEEDDDKVIGATRDYVLNSVTLLLSRTF